MVWDYSFRLWPCFEGLASALLPKTREVLDMSIGMIEVSMTDAEFKEMTGQLSSLGFEVHELSRRPHAEWQTYSEPIGEVSKGAVH